MTEATQKALEGLRNFSTLKWYVIPLLSLVFYIPWGDLCHPHADESPRLWPPGLELLSD